MLAGTENNIGNLSFQLQYHGNMDGIAIKKRTESLVERSLLPALEALFDKYSPELEVISIDEIVCNINVDDNALDITLTEKIIRLLEKQLAEIVSSFKNSATKLPTVEKRFVEALLFYLENGYMPWWASIKSKQQLNEYIAQLNENKIDVDTVNAFLFSLKHDYFVNRICIDFEEFTFWEFFKMLLGPGKNYALAVGWQKDYFTFTDTLPASARSSFLFFYKKSLLKSLAHYTVNLLPFNLTAVNEQFIRMLGAEVIQEFNAISIQNPTDAAKLTGKLKNTSLKTALTLMIKRTEEILPEKLNGQTNGTQEPATEGNAKKEEIPVTQPLYISNSGLVIIAPYLNMFFTRISVAEDGKIINAAKGITLLHYISTGNGLFAEFEVVLPKLLCGLDLQCAITSPYLINDEDIELVNELLDSIIAHWSILKNTSVEGLRSTFLLRDGKLNLQENGFYLKVQRNAVDILLDHLPWSISIIKLPWMKNILYVDWM